MKKNILNVLAAAVAVSLVLAAGAVTAATPAAKSAGPAPVVLEYKMPADRALTYQSKAEEAQVMEVMGQAMDTNTTSTSTFTFKAKGMKDKNFLLGVTIDDIVTTMASSAQGDLSPDLTEVKGKTFDMVLSPLGAEVDVTAAEAITITVAGETGNMASRFKTFFPDLPGKPVQIGDTWPSSDVIEEKTGSVTVRIDLKNVNTLEGLETVDGIECARISTQVTGTLTGAGSQMGQDLTFAGTMKGKNVWFFAVKEGFYVKAATEATTEMSIDVAAAGMTIPMTQTSKAEAKLIKH
jgi:hypothetical protein